MKHRFCSLVGLLDVFNRRSGRRQSSALPEGICREFSLAQIQAATNNFNPDLKISEGLGAVYRGTVDDGTIIVAVKRFSIESTQVLQVFRTEVQMLSQLRHPNLVSLIGFCHEQNNMILVYEYMNRRSLDRHLFGGKDCVSLSPLSWNHRLQICIGAARGLHYLHSGAKRAVIHRSIKSSDILLDDDWSSKLADFGLSKLGPPSMSKTLIRVDSGVTGTVGYIDPEYALSGVLTEKSDVFSFGAVLFEVLCGRRPYAPILPDQQPNGPYPLIVWACELGKEGKIYDAVDPYLKGRIAPECFKKFVEIAASCIHPEGNKRPAMGEVEVTLELALELQMKADSEMEGIAAHGEYMYEEASCCTYFDLSYTYADWNRYSLESEYDSDSS